MCECLQYSITGKALFLFLGNQHDWVPLQRACTCALNTKSKQEGSEVCMQLQSYDLSEITAVWCDILHAWSAGMKDTGSLARTGQLGDKGHPLCESSGNARN